MNTITSTVRALCLNDLVDDEYMIVATRESYEGKWCYWLSKEDTKRYHDLVGHGDIIAPTRRNKDGSFDVLAKLARS